MGSLSEYILHRKLGQGAFAHVMSATHKLTKKQVAIKMIDKDLTKEGSAREKIHNEIEVMKRMNHPFICKYFDSFEDSTHFFIVMEEAQGGTLLDIVNSGVVNTEKEVAVWFAQLLAVMSYLHNDCMIIHRDLKLENVLVDQNQRIRVIDFGLCGTQDGKTSVFETFCGSPAYLAPEIIKGNGYTMEADIWSLGVVLYTIMAGKLPFNGENIKLLFNQIQYQEINFPSSFSEDLCSLLSGMLCRDQNKRLKLEEIAKHPWVKPNTGIINIAKSLVPVTQEEVLWHLSQHCVDVEECKKALEAKKVTEEIIAFRIIKRELENTQLENRLLFLLPGSHYPAISSSNNDFRTGKNFLLFRKQTRVGIASRCCLSDKRRRATALKYTFQIPQKTDAVIPE